MDSTLNSRYDLIIIGAGPAGLLAGCLTAAKGSSVLILEKNSRAGKKLLLSGSGQCNLTNTADIEYFLAAYGDKGRFVRPSLLNFTNLDLEQFFLSRGIPLTRRKDGKVFPSSLRANDILEGLLSECRKQGVPLQYKTAVNKVLRENDHFSLHTQTEVYQAKNILLACGGSSWPGTGSTGDGFRLAERLGHRIVNPRPALTPVYPENYDGTSCSGIALPDTAISLWRGNRKIKERTGDLLFTHKGLSGPGILDFSRLFLAGDELRIRLVNITDREKLDREIIDTCTAYPRRSVKNLIAGFGIPEALILVLLKRCNINPDTTGAALNKSFRRALGDALFGFSYVVHKLGGFNEAMATAGGVDTDQVNPKTMESRLIPGLFFAGEVLDVDGDTGGFNLQFAFSSGALVSNNIR